MASHLDRLKLAQLHIIAAKDKALLREPAASIEELGAAAVILTREIQWLKELIDNQAESPLNPKGAR